MELPHLRYCVAIPEERSITRADGRLWIAQPGLSTQVRRLEAEVDIQLLDQHPRGVELTPAGEVFLERARAALAPAEAARSTGQTWRPGWWGRFASAAARRVVDTHGRCVQDINTITHKAIDEAFTYNTVDDNASVGH